MNTAWDKFKILLIKEQYVKEKSNFKLRNQWQAICKKHDVMPLCIYYVHYYIKVLQLLLAPIQCVFSFKHCLFNRGFDLSSGP
jgi:hypothetical protein